MSEADFAALTGTALGTGDVARGVSSAFTRPNGGGTFAFGYRSLTTTVGFAGMYVDLSNFNPIAGTRKGGSIRAAIKRYSSGSNYAPMIGVIKGTAPTAEGYLLGLSGASSYKIALRKGSPAGGLDHSGSDILRSSTTAYTGTGDLAANWLHVRLDVLVNPHGEVVINVYENDLLTNAVTAPVWTAPNGMAQYTDDSLGALTGSLPHLEGFYAIFGHYTNGQSGALSLFDHLEIARQTAP